MRSIGIEQLLNSFNFVCVAEDRSPPKGLLDTGPQFMPELELDTVWKSEEDMSSENPTSSQQPSEEPQEILENPEKTSENSGKTSENLGKTSEKTNSAEIVPTLPPPPKVNILPRQQIFTKSKSM